MEVGLAEAASDGTEVHRWRHRSARPSTPYCVQTGKNGSRKRTVLSKVKRKRLRRAEKIETKRCPKW